MSKKYIRVDKRIYSHSSVIRLIELHREVSEDPQEIIRYLAREELTKVKNLDLNSPPFDPKILASTIGIPCEKSEELIRSEDAELHPTKDERVIIKYNPKKPKTRQNFSIAHEIVHTFFPDYADKYKARHKIGQFNPESEVEFLCDLGASEIIMPTPEFDLDLHQIGFSLESLTKLSTRYEVSPEAAAIRMITTNHDPCAMMVLAYCHKPMELKKIESEKDQPSLFSDYPRVHLPMKLRVQYFFRAKHFPVFIPKDKSIDKSSPIHQVSVTQNPFRGHTTLDLTSQSLDAYVDAMALPGTYKSDLGSNVLVLLSMVR